jgi:hypothetical protein
MNSLPCPGPSLAAWTLPPWSSISFFTSDSPIPSPPCARSGVRSARTGNREHRVTQTVFVVREPDIALTSKLAELRLQFPGSEVKAVDCPQ